MKKMHYLALPLWAIILVVGALGHCLAGGLGRRRGRTDPCRAAQCRGKG